MKETASGLEFQSIDSETAIEIVDAQMQISMTVPFLNNHEKLEMASLLHEIMMKINTEKGVLIDLDILTNRIASQQSSRPLPN